MTWGGKGWGVDDQSAKSRARATGLRIGGGGSMTNNVGHTLLQVPPGVQCFVGEEARRRRRIEEAVVSVFEGWSYEEIIPPLFDYADVFAGPALGPKTYSFVGRDGALLALRPDFTS